MEGDKSASTFINSIVKNIQMLCHGQVNFSDNVEVIGHLYLNIDSNTKMNYIVNEKCSKFNSNTTFTSNSFHAEPNNVIKLNINANKNRSISRPRKHKAAPIEQEILAKIPKFVEEKFEVSEPERDAEEVSLNLSYSIETETGNIERGELVESKFEPSFSISETDGASESLAASISNVDEESDNEIISPIDEIQMSSASLITPQFDDVSSDYKQAMYVMSSCTPHEILSPKTPMVQRVFSGLVKQACINAGFWDECPYPKDIPQDQIKIFFGSILSVVPHLDSHKDAIWSKLGQRLRDRRFKIKMKRKKKDLVQYVQ